MRERQLGTKQASLAAVFPFARGGRVVVKLSARRAGVPATADELRREAVGALAVRDWDLRAKTLAELARRFPVMIDQPMVDALAAEHDPRAPAPARRAASQPARPAAQ